VQYTTQVNEIVDEFPLLLLKIGNSVLDSSLNKEAMDFHQLLLTNPIGAINTLHLNIFWTGLSDT
jgi:hypothetical protein